MTVDEKAKALIEKWEQGTYYGGAVQKRAALQVAIVEALKEQEHSVVADIIDQARCLSAMIDPIMGDMYCRGWRRALETLKKSIMAGEARNGSAT